MRKNRRPHLLLMPLLLAAGIAAAAVHAPALAAEEDVSQEDPARWYQGDDTARLHYKTLVKEARAAGAQALQECKSLKGAEAKGCRKEARDNQNSDLARAKRILKARSAVE
ncbi:hypothetical protein DXT88_21475 [Herbaspirillum lusitanum]|uniref:hypothetical protein n=2 Tax=Herbaspirillum lusitanum TaxID=213312 RepID=UPI000494491B|nr:hypothetical protein [Herbaspirillum lusitanum]MCW5300747.1 hypothetical protein [Herbaspirillum lusitanum]